MLREVYSDDSDDSNSVVSDSDNETEREFYEVGVEDMKQSLGRIDGIYNPKTRKHQYDAYDPARGPTDEKKASVPKENGQWVLLLKREFDEKLRLKETKLRINSPLVAKAVKKVAKGTRAALEREIAELSWPNDEILRYRNEIKEAAKEKGELSVQHVDVLMKLVEEQYASRIKDMETMFPKRTSTFEILREAFWAGDIVIDQQSAVPRAYRVVDVSYKVTMCNRYLSIKTKFINFNGKKLGTVNRELTIDDFEGVKYLRDLPVCHLKDHPNKEAITEALIERGQKFLSLRGQNYKFHSGVAQALKSFVMVDAETFNKNEANSSISVSSIDEELVNGEPTEEHLLLCTHQVPIFSFEDKSFYWADVNNIAEINFNDAAFDHLILPSSQKGLVRALVESYTRDESFDDYIAGKGKGLILLLHGPPGVGKTMTAEAVADLSRRPLYAITSGELGASPSDMETHLQKALDLASSYHAVLLLDEADVFLEQRSTHDLERNALVSTFLRQLEYYQGIMFLTTNRVKAFDKAFYSRIHVTLHFRELSNGTREEVWRNLGVANNIELDCVALSKSPLNGRQIKNAFGCAKILARDQGEEMAMKHMQIVLDMMNAPGLDEVVDGFE
ncbi:hypothetical protein ASPWEDRAFT_116032 [Aspergillus wentii DTO 134E9]|uniref:AAA+ ATPase domain-containing protein n=1 Tax=Aspergillus wentii DTO 134E9 TaxID=1073089 RepID=A0A1L9RF62_ASPWE|nr:uncharacterized protein ASPWEDRAFT_116032 [Aspergillus wentii DTO 134E9]OJJ33550.1 hypothetical protein ASPWEDRAFT_116032 [Aspergillus wentii DTO 134E9]